MIENIKKDENTGQEEYVKPDYKYKQFVLHTAKYKTLLTKKFEERKKYVAPDPKKVFAFIPGSIKKISVKEGKTVKVGQNLFMLEAMKMLNQVKSPINGRLKKINVKQGDIVMKNQLLLEFE